MALLGSSPGSRPLAWATWRATVGLASVILAARVAYLIWLCPFELAGDEAQYWDWSRRLDFSYYSKGPGIAWLIAASTWLPGPTEWAVRLPAAVSSFVASLLLGRLATRQYGGDERVGFVAAALYPLAPVFSATSQFMTIDPPFFACWIFAAWAGWRIVAGHRGPPAWLLLGASIGLGVLFKYTMLLVVPGLLAYLARRASGLTRREWWAGTAVTMATIVLVASPIWLWNIRYGWPTLAHLLGNLHVRGGDLSPHTQWHWSPIWTLGYLLYPAAVLGPAVATTLILAFRDRPGQAESREVWRFVSYVSLPLVLFYLGVSFRTDIKLNWPVAGYVLLLVPAAGWLVRRAERGLWGIAAWRWSLGLGLVCALMVAFGRWPLERMSGADIFGHRMPEIGLLQRVVGHREKAVRVERAVAEVRREAGQAPFVVGKDHATAALLAFYLHGNPVVYSAGHWLGGRESAYDYFTDTSLADPALRGRPAVLVGAQAWDWSAGLFFDHIERMPVAGRIFAAFEYGGPRRLREKPQAARSAVP